MTSKPEDLAARAAEAAANGTREHPNATGPHPTLDEVEAITGHSPSPGPTGAHLGRAPPRVVWMAWSPARASQ